MLGPVLDALTEWQGNVGMPSYWVGMCRVSCDDAGVAAERPPGWLGPDVIRLAWITASAAEGYEILQTRGLIPMSYRGRFVCGQCGGAGVVNVGSVRPMQCPDCTVGFADHPPCRTQ
jgi:hypothetical protein